MAYKFRANGLLAAKAIRAGVSVRELLVSRFPYQFGDSPTPPSMHVELTDACNLKCVYCDNPFFAFPRKVMSRETVQSIVSSLATKSIARVCVGGGEPTLHPYFAELVPEIRKIAKVLTIVSNGQWENEKTAATVLTTPFDLIEISVDAGGKSMYERSRQGGDFEKLLRNLIALRRLRKKLHSPSQINVRLMVRPSQRAIEGSDKKCWRQFCDSVMPQYIVQPDNIPVQDDVYVSQHSVSKSYPRCTLPFRNLQVRANGDVPLCQIAGSNENHKLIVGNVNRTSILELWNGAVMNQYRRAHRSRQTSAMPICEGCVGC
jgi:MoaA/NifB/PqqE/SkfB family radical SAM enzyme